ncbi:hypothetical protein P22_1327 [Propionispora sp. 2/2-37]|uniref:hypothetical protein n=1 Tax=Propionispora sp. 2/2-37 TaxID=1677858 RepID=UPI0006BB8240|nr:hypothetical protein [Propionispora sp. 2/2-37]CUH95257.1 hypothetical protein P22_1327 [Propionispora sp. 2/2-37]
MRETITINRIIQCTFINKEVAQQISAYMLTDQDKEQTSELLTKYCSGGHACHCPDCQFIIGPSGKTYTKPLEGIYKLLG